MLVLSRRVVAQFAKMFLFSTFLVQVESAQLRRRPHKLPDGSVYGWVNSLPNSNVNEWMNAPPKVLAFAGIDGTAAKLFHDLWTHAHNDSRFLHFPDVCRQEADHVCQRELIAKMQALEKNSIWMVPYQGSHVTCGIDEDWNDDWNDSKNHFYRDLEKLQEATNHAGVKLHILFLKRTLKEDMAVTCAERDCENCLSQASLFTNNTKALKIEIDKLDSSIMSCFRHYDENIMLQDVLTTFALNNNAKTNLVTMFHQRNVSEDVDHLTTDQPLFTQEDAAFDHLCANLSQFTINDFKNILNKSTKLQNDTKHK